MIRSHCQPKRVVRPRRGRFRVIVRHYQLVELFVLIGGIALVWLGSYVGNLPMPINQILGLESARISASSGLRGG
jgi:hypothetical protein